MQSLPTSRLIIAVVLALSVGACRDEHITSYRVAKEQSATPPHAQSPHAEPPVGAAPSAPSAAPAAPKAGPMAGPAVQTAAGSGLAWTAPASWKATNASAMRKASFTLGADGGPTADLAVTAFPGDVGGEIANVNRWRGQVGLPPLSDADAVAAITRIEQNGLKIGLVDVVAAGDQPVHLVGAMVPFGGATWFFKLLGPDAVVAKEKPAFLEFIKTVRPATPAP